MNRVLHNIGTAVTTLSLAIGTGCTKTDTLQSHVKDHVYELSVGGIFHGVETQPGDKIYCQDIQEGRKTCQLKSADGTVVAGGYN